MSAGGGAALIVMAGHLMIIHRHRPYVAPTCPHCHAELPGWEPPSATKWYYIAGGFLVVGLLVGVVVWAFLTLVAWADPYPGAHPTLVDVVRGQWRWLVELAHRIY